MPVVADEAVFSVVPIFRSLASPAEGVLSPSFVVVDSDSWPLLFAVDVRIALSVVLRSLRVPSSAVVDLVAWSFGVDNGARVGVVDVMSLMVLFVVLFVAFEVCIGRVVPKAFELCVPLSGNSSDVR